ncbi:carboxypeptidase-like regulatory domain-containing protein, partial [Sediminibacterium sp.]|uniref:carboxypeptidase-like regulatory domain-containing protein n=1 Tax=Sediminibacterium sp. TaxID=1917865 RepID=UPI003F699C0B
MKRLCCFSIAVLFCIAALSQNHYGAVSGVVSFRGIRIAGATITLKDNATGIRISTRSNASGTYGLYQLSPASQYQLTVYYPEADTLQIQLIQVIAGEDLQIHLPLQPSVNLLAPLTIKSNTLHKQWRNGITILSEEKQNSQHWGNLFLHEPSATVKNDGSGALSFSGQNYRANAFYIDGVLQNDPFGLSTSGILNGENGQGPVAMESIEQI